MPQGLPARLNAALSRPQLHLCDARVADRTKLKTHVMSSLQVFVGGVPRTATEEMLKEFAERAGPVCYLLP